MDKKLRSNFLSIDRKEKKKSPRARARPARDLLMRKLIQSKVALSRPPAGLRPAETDFLSKVGRVSVSASPFGRSRNRLANLPYVYYKEFTMLISFAS
jgi:hypothetical protein